MSNAPDALIVTGPNFEQESLDYVLVTPTGGIQMTMRDALALGANLTMPGPIGSVTPNTGAFTTLSATGTTTLNALVHMAQPASIQFDGSRTWSGTQGAIGNAEIYSFTNQSGTTTTGNPVAFHYFGVASDTVQNPGGHAISNVRSDLTTGAAIIGPRNGMWSNLTIGGVPGDAGQYSAGVFAAQASAAANASGNIIYGTNPTAGLNAGATGSWSVVGEEIDVRAVTGSTPLALTGLTIVTVGGHAVHGSNNIDSAIAIGNQPGTSTGWDYGLRFGGPGTAFPFVSGDTLHYAYPSTGGLTIANGVDFSNLTFTGNAWKSTGSTIDGSGNGTFKSVVMPLTTPASASAAGVTGTVLVDTGFIYVCTASNTWKRAALSTF